ncbi:low-specificity L-threonine aldolase [Bordetella avium]|uniref:low-specificity L-threonine aldolase n=1 Tax=Bordetella avium TaxID=521 RepID=UPI000FDBD774|nr:low-specificity L-threonine aldolase [Bordetella avium]AZY48642.1 low-specificity L-threonine aldolase [Bordetella avium]
MIDFRSDTVTRPSAAMLQVMAQAPVGDDVMGDDPSVIRLQRAVAERAGKEAGLFFPTGTQSNLAGLMAHCGRGDEYLVGQLAHTYKYEGGGAAVLASIQPQPVEHDPDGSLPLAKLAAAIKPEGDAHYARTRLLALENTFHGKVIPQDYILEATAFARSKGLGTHLDGARVFNASVATGLALETLCQPFDSVSICFSKGLGAPVGSVLVGSQALIDVARRWRKVLGGGMRQAGVLAAAAHYALDHNVTRLAQDHENARVLGVGLAALPGVQVLSQHTNMVFVQFAAEHRAALNHSLKEEGILMSAVYEGPVRLVTHLDISPEAIQRTLTVLRRILKA